MELNESSPWQERQTTMKICGFLEKNVEEEKADVCDRNKKGSISGSNLTLQKMGNSSTRHRILWLVSFHKGVACQEGGRGWPLVVDGRQIF